MQHNKILFYLNSKYHQVNGQRVLDNWRALAKPELLVENTNTTLKRNETHVTLISEQGLEVVLSIKELQVNVSQRHWNTTCGKLIYI